MKTFYLYFIFFSFWFPLVHAQTLTEPVDEHVGISPPTQDNTKLIELGEIHVSAPSVSPTLDLEQPNQTASRLGLSIKETPASVTVVDRETIERRGIDNTQEALKSVPGITTASTPGFSGAVFYRGFTSASVTQLFNGITVQYDGIAARAVDSWIYERIEALGGASGFLYGAGAVGGTINYITKLAHLEGDYTEYKGAYGRYDATQLAAGTNKRLNERNAVRLDVSRNTMNGWSDGTKRDAWQIAGSWLTALTPSLRHTLAVEYQNEQVDRPYWGTPLLNPVGDRVRIDKEARFKNYNSQDGLYEQTVGWVRSVLDFKFNESLSVRNTLYHYDALRDFRNVEQYAFNATNTEVIRSNALLQRHDHKLDGNRLEFTMNSDLGAYKSQWAGGMDYSFNRQTTFPKSVAGPFGSVNPYDFSTENFFDLPGMTPGFDPSRTNRIKTLALFLENRTLLDKDVALLTSVRRDSMDLDVTNHRTVTPTNPAYFERHYTPLTGRLALTYDVTSDVNTYVQYSTAADPPAGVLTTASFAQLRNFDLTTGQQWEIGSKFGFLNRRGSGTVALYDITRKNLATTDPNNPGTSIPVGQQSSRGVEVALGYQPSSRWSVSGHFSWNDAQYDQFNEIVGNTAVSRAGNRPTNVPQRIANLWLTYTPQQNVEFGTDLRYVSSRFANTSNTLRDGAYTLWGAFVSYRLNQKTRLFLRGKNLSDKVYAEFLAGNQSAYLGQPRTFELSVHANF